MRVTQAGRRRGTPLTSTRHRRQAPTAVSPGRSHRVGTKMPFSRATSRIVWSSRAPTSRPSSSRVLTRTGALGMDGLRDLTRSGGTLALEVGLVLLAEILHGGEHRGGSTLAQAAKAGVEDQVAELFEKRQVGASG